MPPRLRLHFLSHRAPIQARRTAQGVRVTHAVGGLTTALARAVEAAGGTWTAWAAPPAPDAHAGAELPFAVHAVRLKEASTFYAGFANQVLWPLCHVFLSRCRMLPAFWSAYRQANESFAAAVRAAAEPGDLVWVNDFHLALVPSFLRAAATPARVGIFWHIPFPPPAVFGVCPWREEVLGGLLGADLIGFQTVGDARGFLDCVRDFLDFEVAEDPPRVRLPGRDVRVVVLPVGIDATRLREQAGDPSVQDEARRLRGELGAEVVVLGVDRLDYAKGVPERLLAFERFLDRHPEWRRRVALVQITVPSQFRVDDQRDLKGTIDETVGRIIGRFTYEGRSPLAYLYTAFDHERLAAYYLAADVALVTPLRDGMNLVAKEYVACQAERAGVLVLSEFAGAASELSDALLVNPYDLEAVRRQLAAAVAMAPDERRRRMAALARTVTEHDVHWWVRSFLALLRDAA
jgi:alpha,alpha-trehalose-phosphate synthase [UDP-forming]